MDGEHCSRWTLRSLGKALEAAHGQLWCQNANTSASGSFPNFKTRPSVPMAPFKDEQILVSVFRDLPSSGLSAYLRVPARSSRLAREQLLPSSASPNL
jgi:hypothetical protein